jgi:protein tyrosine/serine phosphatase
VFFAAVSFVLASSISTVAQEATPKTEDSGAAANVAEVKIKNFGQMDDRFFRGGQPKEQQYKELAAIGVKTIIDLRQDPMEYEKREAEAVGIRYVNIPMSDKDYPEMATIEQFLKLVDDPSTGKFFVHCAGGRHRTGVMGAVYRFTRYNWNFDQVYAEMKKYDFYTRWGHGDMKKFVQDYAVSFKHTNTNTAAAASVTTTANH